MKPMRALRWDAVVIGGAALNLLGVVTRETRDCDILDPPVAAELLEAARAFAAQRRALGEVLRDDWLNSEPASLARDLPDGWKTRLMVVFTGAALTLRSLGRPDLLKTKLFAYCDRRTDLADCLALAPTPQELADALPWVEYQDANELWPPYVRELFTDLARRLGHGL
jgi:hypothetical protein